MSETFEWCLNKTRLDIWDKQVFCVNEFGDKYWCLNGQLHRENGPAVEYANGTKVWYLNGRCYTESDYWKELQK